MHQPRETEVSRSNTIKNHDDRPVKGLSSEDFDYYYPLSSLQKKEGKIRTASLENDSEFEKVKNMKDKWIASKQKVKLIFIRK